MHDEALALLSTDLAERFGRQDDIAILCDPGPHSGPAFFAVLRAGRCVSYCDRPRPPEMLCAMAAEHVTGMLATPWLLCLIEQALRNELARLPRYRRRFFRAVLGLAPLLPLSTRRQLFRRLHRRFGDCHYAINGGAPLAGRTLRFFAAIGIPVYQVDRLLRMARAPQLSAVKENGYPSAHAARLENPRQRPPALEAWPARRIART